ncbi:MAG: 3'-5' exonuclease [Clostridiales bacterium]|nr:3'-5' exonuclease [Clostridiales bacterium]
MADTHSIKQSGFPDEERHLADTLRLLDRALTKAQEDVARLDREYKETKKYMADSRNETDSHERFQAERLLEQTDRTGVFAVQTRDRIKKIRESPYFARIDFRRDNGNECEIFYIGRFGYSENGKHLIYDWRAPVSAMFYDYEAGRAGFDAPVGRVDGELTRKRQFGIKNGVLEYTLESGQGICDDVLQRELARTSDERMKTIISTIQREQNAVIRNERSKVMIIQGVAGSGKTSIALHRIAYMLYRHRKQITSRDVMIISPNKVFSDYIRGVIPELGEEPICETGLYEIAKDVFKAVLKDAVSFEKEPDAPEINGRKRIGRIRFKSTSEFVKMLEDYREELEERVFDAKALCFDSYEIPAEWIKARFHAYAGQPVRVRIASVADDIRSYLRSRMGMWDEPPKKVVILKSLGRMLKIKDSMALYKDFYRSKGAGGMLYFPEKNTLEWEDVYPFMYMLALFEGLPENREVLHLIIDEMQDYTPIQYAVLNMLFSCRKTILGDFGQNLNPYSCFDIEDIRGLYTDAEFVVLNKSYRSTCEIMNFAKAVCRHPEIETVDRHGETPKIIGCKDEEEELKAIIAQIQDFKKGSSSSLGIIAKTESEAGRLYERLERFLNENADDCRSEGFDKCTDDRIGDCKEEQTDEHMSDRGGALFGERIDDHEDEFRITLLTENSTRFHSGVTVTSIRMAKGLEFDEVLIPDADDEEYGAEGDDRLLYIACTRAMHRLTLYYTGEPSCCLPAEVCKQSYRIPE